MKPSFKLTWVFADGSRQVVDAYRQLNILAHAEIYEIKLPQACGGQAECGTCRFRVLEGTLSAPPPDERELTENFPKAFASDERLACMSRPRSDLTVGLLKVRPPDLRGELEAAAANAAAAAADAAADEEWG